MFARQMASELKLMASQHPVVTVIGPRYSGKTTLARGTFPQKPYVNLESLSVRDFAENDPIGFLQSYPNGAILDEIQRMPKLLSQIQVIVDESDIKGMFILTGSNQLGLSNSISQSLAGRTAVLRLLPMSMQELKSAGFNFTLDEILYNGCYPRLYKDNLSPNKEYNNYVQTYLERDLRQMLEVKNLMLFKKFLKLCASRIGQVFVKENIANEVGVTAKTIMHWLSILEGSYLIFLLPPYFENFGKRVIKSPKLYFCDVGLAAYLLGILNVEHAQRDPLRGNLVENLIVLELIKSRWNQGLDDRLFFYRDSNKNEVDILFQYGNQLLPIEVKSSQTFNSSFLKGLLYFKKLIGERVINPHLVYAGEGGYNLNGVQLLNFADAAKVFN